MRSAGKSKRDSKREMRFGSKQWQSEVRVRELMNERKDELILELPKYL